MKRSLQPFCVDRAKPVRQHNRTGREPRPWAGGDVLTHAGSNTMWYSVVWIAPEKDCAFVVVTNCYGDKARSGTDAAVAALLERQKLR